MQERGYRIVVEGRLSDRVAAGFHGVRLEALGARTVLLGPPGDGRQLERVLARLRNLGIELVSVDAGA